MEMSSPTSAASGIDIAVIGAGIIGACIAHQLTRRGAAVTLVDRDEPGKGCSYGNSGAISESSVTPMAMPGVLASIPGMLADPRGPLYLPPAYLPRAAPWLARFVASTRADRIEAAAAGLAAFHAGAVEKHVALTRELGIPEILARRGHLHLYPDQTSLDKDASAWAFRRRFGFAFEQLDRAGIVALEPQVGPRYQLGMFLADHATVLNPFRYVQAIVKAAGDGGTRLLREDVSRITPLAGGRWQVHCDEGTQEFDQVVVAAGAWSRRLLDPLGVRLHLESQRGYHVQFQGGPKVVSRTVVLADRKVFVTPMEDGIRVGGTVEIGGLSRPPNQKRAELLARIAGETFAELDHVESTQWMGHRPCMPDTVPVVGAAPGNPGLWIATGHGHLGMTDSISTAERIADGVLKFVH
jgi:D-amino-acid dehydrogenase